MKGDARTVPTISSICNETGQARLDCLRALPAETLLDLTQTLGSWPTVPSPSRRPLVPLG
jgi:hypothetical protein